MKSPLCFERLVLGFIDASNSHHWRKFQHFSRSTRFTNVCTVPASKIQQKKVGRFFQSKYSFKKCFAFSRTFSSEKGVSVLLFTSNFFYFPSSFRKMQNYIDICRNCAQLLHTILRNFRNCRT